MKPTIYWTFFEDGQWRFLVAATEKGLCFTGSQDREEDELIEWAAKRFKGSQLVEDAEKLKPYIEQFHAYVRGERKQLEMALDYRGTDFQLAVWQALQDIPYGEKASYSVIAERIGKPKAVRAVGTAIGTNPVMIVIPCHRVIGKNGSLAGFRGGLLLKQMLLDHESLLKEKAL